MNLRYFYFLFLFSCSIEDETIGELTYYEDCYFEEDKVRNRLISGLYDTRNGLCIYA